MPFEHAPRCTHIKVTGHTCGSPALHGEFYCYFHTRMIKGVRCRPDMRIIPYTLLENPAAIQVAIMELIGAIIEGRIEYRRASLVMKGLHLAASLSKRAHFDMNPDQMVTDLPNYHQQYLDEHPEHCDSVHTGDVASYLSTQRPPDPKSHRDPKTPRDSNAPRDPESRVEAQLAASKTDPIPRCRPERTEGPAVPPPTITKGAVPPAPQSAIENRKSTISLNPRQQSQWKDIEQVERAIAGALNGNLTDLKTAFTAAGLGPTKTR